MLMLYASSMTYDLPGFRGPCRLRDAGQDRKLNSVIGFLKSVAKQRTDFIAG
jgi:hypothetical protein